MPLLPPSVPLDTPAGSRRRRVRIASRRSSRGRCRAIPNQGILTANGLVRVQEELERKRADSSTTSPPAWPLSSRRAAGGERPGPLASPSPSSGSIAHADVARTSSRRCRFRRAREVYGCLIQGTGWRGRGGGKGARPYGGRGLAARRDLLPPLAKVLFARSGPRNVLFESQIRRLQSNISRA